MHPHRLQWMDIAWLNSRLIPMDSRLWHPQCNAPGYLGGTHLHRTNWTGRPWSVSMLILLDRPMGHPRCKANQLLEMTAWGSINLCKQLVYTVTQLNSQMDHPQRRAAHLVESQWVGTGLGLRSP